jgi:tetratricopeptide (TPR) repeat protein
VLNLIQSSLYKTLIKNYNGAISDINLAIKAEPDNFLVYYCRANIRSEMIDYMKLLEQENEVILINPMNNISNDKLRSNESIQDYDLVISDYQKSLSLAPEFIFSGFNLANTYLKTREYRKAITIYNQVIKLEPIFAEAYYNRGLTYIYLKESENGCMDMSVSGEFGLQNAYTVIARFCEN